MIGAQKTELFNRIEAAIKAGENTGRVVADWCRENNVPISDEEVGDLWIATIANYPKVRAWRE